MTRSFIILTLLVSMSAVERYVSLPSASVSQQQQQQTPKQRDGGLKAPLAKLPRPQR